MSDPPPHPEIVFGQSLETAGSIGRALEDAADTEPLQSWPERFSGVGLDVGSEASDGGEPSALGGSGGGWADVTPSPFPTFGTSVSSLRSLEQPLRQGSELAAAIQAATAAVAAQRGSSASCSAAAAEADERDSPLERLRHHAKHVFVFSTAGKPVYSYHGGEEELAGVMAAAQAIMAVVQGRGQGLRYVRAGHQVVAFLERPPLCLVGVSALAEPAAVLRMQLSLVHGQVVSLLTSSALSSIFRRSPGYDVRKLLGAGEGMLTSLIDSFSVSPAALLGAYPSLPLLAGVRSAVAAALAAAVRAAHALFGLMVAGGAVVAVSAATGTPQLQQWDILLLLNFLHSSGTLRQAEAFAPICLPLFNPAANLQAYISYTDPYSETAIVLLCGGTPSFHVLSAAWQQMQQHLESSGALQAVEQAAREQGSSTGGSGGGSSSATRRGGRPPAATTVSGSRGLLDISSLPSGAGGGQFGTTPLLHFCYKLTSRQQFVSTPFSPQLLAMELQQPIMVAFSQLRAGMFEHGDRTAASPLQRLRYEARPRFVLLAAATPESELYLALDPLTDKAEAEGVQRQLAAWLRSRHDLLFQL